MITVGSVCSGIEAASVAWQPLGMKFEWFSEIEPFPSRLLKERYPNTSNLGDMKHIPHAILNGEIYAPDLICGGTPCQAFSLAGHKAGLGDERADLTMRFIDIIEANDSMLKRNGQKSTIIFWENVEGILKDKTNAFGRFISSMAGFEEPLNCSKWSSDGELRGPKRNLAWRVIDAKFLGLPQQRRRLYLLAGGKDFIPEAILSEICEEKSKDYTCSPLTFEKAGHRFEVFREYTDCLYSSYGTKWNGNAAANNGSLFVVQDGRIRRFSPLECERLMGFPDNYTNLTGAKKTSRYQALGNSWAVPVVRRIGELLLNPAEVQRRDDFKSIADIISYETDESIFISPVGCYGIIRRKQEKNLTMNARLENILMDISSEMPMEEIEKRSRIQRRGRYSDIDTQLSFF